MKIAFRPALLLTLTLLSSSTFRCHGQGIKKCQHDDCLGCLNDPECGSYYGDNGCYNGCVIADIPCYRTTAAEGSTTPAQVCARYYKNEADAAICSAAPQDCSSCTSTPLSDGDGNCAWFGRVPGREYCGRPGCTMMGCGDSDPANCPATQPEADGFKLIRLGEDDSLCVGIAGGTPMPGKILKLADCDESSDNMRWKMDARGRIRTKTQYNGASLCWHPKAMVQGSSIKLKNCKRSRKQRFSSTTTSDAAPLRSRDPNLCIAYATSSPDAGVKVKLQNCSGNSSQDWS